MRVSINVNAWVFTKQSQYSTAIVIKYSCKHLESLQL